MSVKEVAVLGATGVVGQKVLAMLQEEKGVKVTEVAASSRSAGKVYGDSILWNESRPLDPNVASLKIKPLNEVTAPYVISALPSGIAREVELQLAKNGQHVFSNASAYRMDPKVPLMIPEINGANIQDLSMQETEGKIITNPNCAAVFLCLALAPLLEIGKIKNLDVVTLQAVSGAGSSLAAHLITGNTIPYIHTEEEKIEEEVKKILGCGDKIPDFDVLVHVNRVPVVHGHSVNAHIEFEDNINLESVNNVYREWNSKYPGLFNLYDNPWFPQPLKNITEYDMSAHIGRIKMSKNPRRMGLLAMGHNLVRGAAGAAIANMKAGWEAGL